MKTNSLKSRCVTSVTALLSLHSWQLFECDKLGNDLFLSDPDRAARIHEAVSEGEDGSTHSEHIEDWREFADELYSSIRSEAWGLELTTHEDEALSAFIDKAEAELLEEINECEAFHSKNGSLDQQVG